VILFNAFNLTQFNLRKRDVLVRSCESVNGASALALLNRHAQRLFSDFQAVKKFRFGLDRAKSFDQRDGVGMAAIAANTSALVVSALSVPRIYRC